MTPKHNKASASSDKKLRIDFSTFWAILDRCHAISISKTNHPRSPSACRVISIFQAIPDRRQRLILEPPFAMPSPASESSSSSSSSWSSSSPWSSSTSKPFWPKLILIKDVSCFRRWNPTGRQECVRGDHPTHPSAQSRLHCRDMSTSKTGRQTA